MFEGAAREDEVLDATCMWCGRVPVLSRPREQEAVSVRARRGCREKCQAVVVVVVVDMFVIASYEGEGRGGRSLTMLKPKLRAEAPSKQRFSICMHA